MTDSRWEKVAIFQSKMLRLYPELDIYISPHTVKVFKSNLIRKQFSEADDTYSDDVRGDGDLVYKILVASFSISIYRSSTGFIPPSRKWSSFIRIHIWIYFGDSRACNGSQSSFPADKWLIRRASICTCFISPARDHPLLQSKKWPCECYISRLIKSLRHDC